MSERMVTERIATCFSMMGAAVGSFLSGGVYGFERGTLLGAELPSVSKVNISAGGLNIFESATSRYVIMVVLFFLVALILNNFCGRLSTYVSVALALLAGISAAGLVRLKFSVLANESFLSQTSSGLITKSLGFDVLCVLLSLGILISLIWQISHLRYNPND